jgi:hypothetical protein
MKARSSRWMLQALLLVLLASSSACFTYVPVQMASLAPQEDVRVRITDGAGARLIKDLGVYTTQLDGEFEAHGDSVSVTVPIIREYRGLALPATNQSLYLSRSEVVEIRQRRLSTTRTVLATAGAVAGFVVLVESVQAIFNPSEATEEPPPPPPVGIRIPLRPLTLIRIPIP